MNYELKSPQAPKPPSPLRGVLGIESPLRGGCELLIVNCELLIVNYEL
jgi:hypothetical protein